MKKTLILIIFCFSAFLSKSQITLAVSSFNASCSGSCDGGAIVIPSGGTPGYTYSWSSGCTTNSCTALCAGSYTVTVFDSGGSSATASVIITEPTPVAIAPISPVTICIGQSTTLTANASGGNGGYTYTWNGTFVGQNYTVSPTSTTTYTVMATDINGCSAAPVNVTVTVNPPLAVVSSGTALICVGSSTTISATAFGGNGGPYNYTWMPLGTGSGSSVSVSPTATTTYTVTADDGCSPTSAATVTISVSPCTGIQSLTTENSVTNIYPNPFTTQTTIDLNTNYKNATLKIIDVLGKELKSINFSGKQVILEREELNNGIYFIQIISENKTIAINKIIIN